MLPAIDIFLIYTYNVIESWARLPSGDVTCCAGHLQNYWASPGRYLFLIVFIYLLSAYYFIHFFIYPPANLLTYLSINLSTYLLIFYPSIHPSTIYLSISLSIYLSIHPFPHLLAYLSIIYLSVFPSIYLSVSLFFYLSIYVSIFQLSTYLSNHLFITLSTYLSIFLSIYPSIHLPIYFSIYSIYLSSIIIHCHSFLHHSPRVP